MAAISTTNRTQLHSLAIPTPPLNPSTDERAASASSNQQSSQRVDPSSLLSSLIFFSAQLSFYEGNFDTTVEAYRSAYEKAATEEEKCTTLSSLGRVLFLMGQFTEADKCINQQAFLIRRIKRNGTFDQCRYLEADYYANRLDYLVNNAQRNGDATLRTKYQEEVNSLIRDVESLLQELEIPTSINHELFVYIRLNNTLARLYHSLAEPEKAIDLLNKSHKIMLNLSSHTSRNIDKRYEHQFGLQMMDTMELLGYAHQNIQRFDEAHQFFNFACNFSTEMDIPHARATHLLYKGVCRYQSLMLRRRSRAFINVSEIADQINAQLGFPTNNAEQAQARDKQEVRQGIQDIKDAIKVFTKVENKFRVTPNQIKYNNIHDHAWLMLENWLYEEKEHEEALEIVARRPARALLASLTPPILLSPDQGLNLRQMTELAGRLKTTFIFYSLAPQLGNPTCKPEDQKIRTWVVMNDKVHTQELPSIDLVNKVNNFLERMLKVTVKLRQNLWMEIGKVKPDANSKTFALDEFIDGLAKDRTIHHPPIVKARKRLRKEINRINKLLAEFYDILIRPISTILPKRESTITFIAEGSLAHLTFAALKERESNRYLIQDYIVSTAPSVHFLDALNRQQTRNLKKNFFITTNPSSDLAYASKEAEKLEEVARENGYTVVPLKQQEATRSAVKEKLNRLDYTFVHFSCHGSERAENTESVFKGALKLANSTQADEFLYSEEVVKMQIKAEIVFLNTCCSAKGQIHQEGNVGLMWAFLVAGARSTITCLWPLYDSPLTVQMIQHFYKQVFLGKSTATALREIVLQNIDKEKDRPDKWGLFVHSGLDHKLYSNSP